MAALVPIQLGGGSRRRRPASSFTLPPPLGHLTKLLHITGEHLQGAHQLRPITHPAPRREGTLGERVYVTCVRGNAFKTHTVHHACVTEGGTGAGSSGRMWGDWQCPSRSSQLSLKELTTVPAGAHNCPCHRPRSLSGSEQLKHFPRQSLCTAPSLKYCKGCDSAFCSKESTQSGAPALCRAPTSPCAATAVMELPVPQGSDAASGLPSVEPALQNLPAQACGLPALGGSTSDWEHPTP